MVIEVEEFVGVDLVEEVVEDEVLPVLGAVVVVVVVVVYIVIADDSMEEAPATPAKPSDDDREVLEEAPATPAKPSDDNREVLEEAPAKPSDDDREVCGPVSPADADDVATELIFSDVGDDAGIA